MGRQHKLIVTYDEDARKEYLTGFHKRKQARRKAAQDKQKDMEKQAKREAKEERRKQDKEMADYMTTLQTFDTAPELGNVNRPNSSKKRKREAESEDDDDHQEKEFADEFSKRQFGADAVVVSTTIGLPDDDGGAEVDALRELAVGAPRPQPIRAGPKLKKPHKQNKGGNNHRRDGDKDKKKGKRKGGGGKRPSE